MDVRGWLSFIGIMIIYEASIVLVSAKPSCDEFGGSIKNLNYTPANGLTTLVVARAAQNSPGMSFGECSLLNNLQGCGSIRISDNIFEDKRVTISGWNRAGTVGEHYGFKVQHRSDSGLHIYDFEPTEIRMRTFTDENGVRHRRREDYGYIPEHIRRRFEFTIALVAANNTDGMTGVGFRFCQTGSNSSLDNFFAQSGFVAYDAREEADYFNIVHAVVSDGNGLFSNFVEVPINKWTDF